MPLPVSALRGEEPSDQLHIFPKTSKQNVEEGDEDGWELGTATVVIAGRLLMHRKSVRPFALSMHGRMAGAAAAELFISTVHCASLTSLSIADCRLTGAPVAKALAALLLKGSLSRLDASGNLLFFSEEEAETEWAEKSAESMAGELASP
eukprot:260711-Prymnesium_polylepis.1